MNLTDVPQSVLDLLNGHAGYEDAWPEPQTIVRPLHPVEPFREELLPEVLRRRAFDVAYRMQCPPDFVAIPTLVMLGSLIGTGCAIRPKQQDDWMEYPNLWGGIVAPPGALKSPAISQALLPLRRVEWRANEEYQAANARYLFDKLTSELERDALKKKLKEGKGTPEDKTRLAELAQDLPAPVLRRFRTQDATVEKLGELLSVNPRGLLTDRDELVGLLAALDRPGQEGARAFYLEGWNGSSAFHTDRIGRGSIYIPQLCLSVFGGVQPGRLQDYLYDARSFRNDGLIQRFQLLVYPDPRPNVAVIDEPHDAQALEALERVVERLAYGEFQSLGAECETRGERSIHFFRFHPDALFKFKAWLAELNRKLAAEETPIMAEHLSKFRKLVPALSLIFHVVEQAQTGVHEPLVSCESLERAIAWAHYLESHARRIYGVTTDYEQLAAERLAKEISLGSVEDGFSERDVYRKGWHYLDNPEQVRAACRELEEAGWIRRNPVGYTNGRPPSPTYTINPKAKG